ncbi:unnamed protein product [Candida verbasci]|uniref:Protein-S-isoprenylcysteine O-methyltransferase n=1 Tax=Candida verbasci TaxID=1227364 RepID=A0A9W4U230_9ASCO|nr:unnamed protein product [Candida verbasci]
MNYEPNNVNLIKVVGKSYLLGIIFTWSIYLTIINEYHRPLTNYFTFISIFHSLEFINTYLFNRSQIDDDSFILEDYELHGIYLCSILEHYFINWKFETFYLGLILIIFGQFIRNLAMYTARESFNHYIQRDSKPNHKLITHGIFKYVRHPSYFGFFIWFIGMELLLNNVIILVVGGYILWNFFKKRIVFEEGLLVNFFGEDYIKYRSRTRTWMFI